MDKLIDLIKSTKTFITDNTLRSAVTEKGVADFVTKVDTSIQAYLKAELFKLYPDIQFMGEEGGNSEIDFSKKVWILDPVDGTTNLIHDFKMSAVSLGLIDNGEPVLGIIYNPFSEELFCAEKGKGAFLNGEKISVSTENQLIKSLVAFGTSPYEKDLADVNFDILKRVYLHTSDIRRGGSAALDLAYVACGRADAYFERNLKPWDYCAGICVLNEAGGKVSDMHGGKICFDRNSDMLATNSLLHNELLDLVKY